MKIVSIALVTLCAGAVLGVAAPRAAAQPGAAPAEPADPAMAAKREKVRQKIAAMRAWKLTEALGLDEATAGRLFPMLDQYDDRFAAGLRDGAALRRQLRAELSSGQPDAQKVNHLIDALLANQRAMWKLQEERFRDVRRILRPDQAARALIVLPQIDRAIGKFVRKAMKRGRMGPGRGGGPGMGPGRGPGRGGPPVGPSPGRRAPAGPR